MLATETGLARRFSILLARRLGAEVPPEACRPLARACREARARPEAYLDRMQAAIHRLSAEFLGREPDPTLMLEGLVAGTPLAVVAIVHGSEEYRRHALRTVYGDVAPAPPAGRALFDHVAKTGGTTVTSAFRHLFPLHVVSPHVNQWSDRGRPLDPRWPIVAGHIGARHHHMLPDAGARLRMTVVREPVSWITSTYTYWRHSIVPGDPDYDTPGPAAARAMGFGAFVRDPETLTDLRNFQSRFLSVDDDEARPVEEILAPYQLVGVTEDIPGFLRRAFAALGVEAPMPVEALVATVPQNSSLQRIEVAEADRAHLREICARDIALHAAARRRAADPAAG